MSKWKPGDVVALRVTPDSEEVRALRLPADGGRWSYAHWAHVGGSGVAYDNINTNAVARPLIVIDPKDIPVAGGVLAPVWLRSLARDLRDDDRSVSTSLENVLTFLADAIDATNPPRRTKVYSHIIAEQTSDDLSRSLCGKVWRAGEDAEVLGQCPNCRDLAEEWVV